MSDRAPEFETTDRKGTTDVFTGTVGAAWTAVPASPGVEIQSFIVHNDADTVITSTISISLDTGTTTIDIIYPSGFSYQLTKDTQRQIWIKAAVAGVPYRITMNREQT